MRNAGWMDLEWGKKSWKCLTFLHELQCSQKQNCRHAVSLTLEIQAVADDANADQRKQSTNKLIFFSDVIWTCDNGHYCTIWTVIAVHFWICIDRQSWSMAMQTNQYIHKHSNHFPWTDDWATVMNHNTCYKYWRYYFLEAFPKLTSAGFKMLALCRNWFWARLNSLHPQNFLKSIKHILYKWWWPSRSKLNDSILSHDQRYLVIQSMRPNGRRTDCTLVLNVAFADSTKSRQ